MYIARQECGLDVLHLVDLELTLKRPIGRVTGKIASFSLYSNVFTEQNHIYYEGCHRYFKSNRTQVVRVPIG